jgi:thiol-disulfide isomerase/thioredoxin
MKVNNKLKQGKDTEKDLADEIKEYDTLLAKNKAEKTEEVAQILGMKADLYLQVLNDPEKAAEALKQLKQDFPQSKFSQRADARLQTLQQPIERRRIDRSLVAGVQFPGFDEKDLNGDPLTLASYRGKVVLIDFWATWCPPCLIDLPQVLKVYEKYHSQGFEIVGVSLDDDRQKLQDFLKVKRMSWQQFFDGQRWDNKLAVQCGVNSTPATYLLDRDGRIIAKNLHAEELAEAVAKALAKK